MCMELVKFGRLTATERCLSADLLAQSEMSQESDIAWSDEDPYQKGKKSEHYNPQNIVIHR